MAQSRQRLQLAGFPPGPPGRQLADSPGALPGWSPLAANQPRPTQLVDQPSAKRGCTQGCARAAADRSQRRYFGVTQIPRGGWQRLSALSRTFQVANKKIARHATAGGGAYSADSKADTMDPPQERYKAECRASLR
jgi:hypothetical protein